MTAFGTLAYGTMPWRPLVAMRYGARLFELRHHDRLCIETRRIEAGAYEYRMTGEVATDAR